MGLRAPGGHRTRVKSAQKLSCPTAYSLTLTLYSSAFPVSIKVSLQFPPLFQKQRGSHCCLRKQQSRPTRTVTRPGRRRPWLIKS